MRGASEKSTGSKLSPTVNCLSAWRTATSSQFCHPKRMSDHPLGLGVVIFSFSISIHKWILLLLCPLFLRETPHMRKNTWYLSSCRWLISLSLIPAPVFLQMPPLRSSLCLRKSAAYGHPSFFICLFGEHLGGLHTSVCMSSAVICMRMQAALWDAHSGERAQRWESWVTWTTTFLKTVNTCQLKCLDEDS